MEKRLLEYVNEGETAHLDLEVVQVPNNKVHKELREELKELPGSITLAWVVLEADYIKARIEGKPPLLSKLMEDLEKDGWAW